MGFLQPMWLFLGLAVAVPIVLHLFHRHQGPRVVFPALRYLRRAEKESARQIRLRQLLLLLLRAAAILLLALAAGRPFVRAAGSQHEPSAIAIVFDNSMSSGLVVGDRRVLDELRDRALEVLDAAAPDDRFWLIAAGSPWTPAFTGDAIEVAQRLRSLEPTSAAADLAAALAHARTLLTAGAEGRAAEIHLLSDLQATNLGDVESLRDGGPPVIAFAPRRDVPPNTWIEQVEVGGGLAPVAGERASIAAHVRGSGDADSIAVRLFLDDHVVAVAVTPRGSAALLSLPARAARDIAGWVETDPDALRADDRRYFAVRVLPPPRVAATGTLPFVDDALAVLEAAGRILRSEPANADVVFVPAALDIAAVPLTAAAVVLPPESPLELPAVNRRLGAAGVPWRFEAPPGGGEARFQLDGGDAMLNPLTEARLFRVFPLVSQEDAAARDTVLLRLSDDAPWAVGGRIPDGPRYLLLASTFSDSSSTLPTSAAMLPLLDRILGRWSANRDAERVAAPGEELALPAGAVAVERPDGASETVSGGTWRVSGEAGIYRVLGSDTILATFVVNPPASESRLATLSRRDLEGALPGWNVRTVAADDWASTAYLQRLGSEIWRPLLFLALALLLLEAIVAATGRSGTARRAREPAEAGAAETG